MNSTDGTASNTCGACLPSPSGTRGSGACLRRGTGWVSSRSITTARRSVSYSHRKSRQSLLIRKPPRVLWIEPYWDLPPTGEDATHTETHYIQTYRDLLEQAVSSHLMSDVPVGVFLSGGVDSCAVAAQMTKIRQAPIETFSVGYAEQVLHRTTLCPGGGGTFEIRPPRGSPHPPGILRCAPKLIWHEDERIVWPSSVSLLFYGPG